MTEPWPTPLMSDVTVEHAERIWPRDLSFRPDKLRLARHARGWSMTELAAVSGLPVRRISRLERNLTTPTDDDKVRLCEALSFPPKFFAQDDPVIVPHCLQHVR